MIKLSVIIPAYNEEKRIKPTLESYLSYLSAIYKRDFEIIVVCDGTDGTSRIVRKISKKRKEVKLLEFSHRLGKGGAVLEGFKRAGGDYIGFTDADNSVTPEYFYKLVEKLRSSMADGVIGSRRVKGAKVLVERSLTRQMASHMFNLLVKILCGLDFKDTQCGAKVFRRKALMDVLPEIKSKGFEFDVELLWRLKNYRVLEAPVNWRYKGESRFGLRYGIKMFRGMLDFLKTSRKAQKFRDRR